MKSNSIYSVRNKHTSNENQPPQLSDVKHRRALKEINPTMFKSLNLDRTMLLSPPREPSSSTKLENRLFTPN